MRGLLGRRRQPPLLPFFPAAKRSSAPASLLFARLRRLVPASHLLRLLLLLALFSLVPPAFFRLRLRRFHRMRERKCGWITSPPMVCAHGGDSTNAFPNSMEAFRMALDARVDCVEVHVSRSSDAMFALFGAMCFGQVLDDASVRAVADAVSDMMLHAMTQLDIFFFLPAVTTRLFHGRLRAKRDRLKAIYMPLIDTRRRRRTKKQQQLDGKNNNTVPSWTRSCSPPTRSTPVLVLASPRSLLIAGLAPVQDQGNPVARFMGRIGSKRACMHYWARPM